MTDDTLLAQAREKHETGQLDGAELDCRAILDSDPDHPEALNLLGIIALQSGRSQEAVDLLKHATQERADFHEAFNNLGLALSATEQHEQAREAYEEAISIEPSFAAAHFNQGASYQSEKHYEKALQAFEKTLAVDPDLTDAHLNQGLCLQRMGRIEDAVESFRNVIEREPDNANAYLNLGLAFRQLGEDSQCVDALRKATTIAPERTDAFVFLGQTLQLLGQDHEGLRALEHAAELDPDSPSVQFELTKALMKSGDPRAPDARLNLGIALLKAGESESALEAFDANLALQGPLPTPELAMKVLALNAAGRHQEMETALGYDQFLHAATINCPADYNTVDDFNLDLGTHTRSHPGTLNGTGGPIAALEKMVADAIGSVHDAMKNGAEHPFVQSAPQTTTTLLRGMSQTSSTSGLPLYYPDAWLAGIYCVDILGNVAPEALTEI